MIVENIGYLKVENLKGMKKFSIYETTKDTHILVKDTDEERLTFFYPQMDRIPWKNVEGKRVCGGIKVFDSEKDDIKHLDLSKWNNGNQIMSYKPFNLFG